MSEREREREREGERERERERQKAGVTMTGPRGESVSQISANRHHLV